MGSKTLFGHHKNFIGKNNDGDNNDNDTSMNTHLVKEAGMEISDFEMVTNYY